MPTRRQPRGPVTTLREMHAVLAQLMRKRMGRRYDARRSYRMCELWSMDAPPDVLECTPMMDRLDNQIGFAFSEDVMWQAYDMESIADSALYLYNVMRSELDAKGVTAKKQLKKKVSYRPSRTPDCLHRRAAMAFFVSG